ncbi:MAG TPA: hypothetical protein VLO11_00200, partial [Luteolibacter sp.]|nr:hypothetical protein [Luteolibacter sp.]
MEEAKPSAARKVEPLLGWVALLLLLVGCFFVLRPFMTALMWAIILTYSLYPLQRLFTRWFRGSRTLAACLVTLTVAVFFAGPVVLIGVSLAQDGKELAVATRDWFMAAPEEPPGWVSGVPVLGDELDGYWRAFAEDRNRWIEELDEALKTKPPRPETDGGMMLREAPEPRGGAAIGETSDGAEEGRESPQLVMMIGKVLVWAKSGLITAGLAVGQGVTQVLL